MLPDNEPGAPTLGEFADKLRSRAGELMRTHPVAATHLVLAAASIAPTCPHEQLVAEHYADLTAPLTQQLASLHRRRTAPQKRPSRRRRYGSR